MIFEPPPPLITYTIYERPSDFPEWFVVRKWNVTAGGFDPDLAQWICETLDEAREIIAGELVGGFCVPRSTEDDPVIVETWM